MLEIADYIEFGFISVVFLFYIFLILDLLLKLAVFLNVLNII